MPFSSNSRYSDLYDFLNDEQYAEADIYTAFRKLMELDQKSMFVYIQPTAKNGVYKAFFPLTYSF